MSPINTRHQTRAQQVKTILANQLDAQATRSKLLKSLALVASTFAVPLSLRPFVNPIAPNITLQTTGLQLNPNGVYNYDPLTPSIVPNFNRYENEIVKCSAALQAVGKRSNLSINGEPLTPAQSISRVAIGSAGFMLINQIEAKLQNASDPFSIQFSSPKPNLEAHFNALKEIYLIFVFLQKNYLNILTHLINYILKSRPLADFIEFDRSVTPKLARRVPELNLSVLNKTISLEFPPNFTRQFEIFGQIVKLTKETEVYALFRRNDYLAALFLICSSLAAYRFILPNLFQKIWAQYAPSAVDLSLGEIADLPQAKLNQTQDELSAKKSSLEDSLTLFNRWFLYPSYGAVFLAIYYNIQEYGISTPLVPYFTSLALQTLYGAYAEARERRQLNLNLQKNKNRLEQFFSKQIVVEITSLASAQFFTLRPIKDPHFSGDEKFELIVNSLEKQGLRICHRDKTTHEILLFANQSIPDSLATHFARSCELRKTFNSLKNSFKNFCFRITEEMNLQVIFHPDMLDEIKKLPHLGSFQITRESPLVLESNGSPDINDASAVLRKIPVGSLPAKTPSPPNPTTGTFERAPQKAKIKTRAPVQAAAQGKEAAAPQSQQNENVYPLLGHANPKATIQINFTLEDCYGNELLFKKLLEKAQKVARGWFDKQGIKFFEHQRGESLGEIKVLGQYGDVRVAIRKLEQPANEAPRYATDTAVIFDAHSKTGLKNLLRFG